MNAFSFTNRTVFYYCVNASIAELKWMVYTASSNFCFLKAFHDLLHSQGKIICFVIGIYHKLFSTVSQWLNS